MRYMLTAITVTQATNGKAQLRPIQNVVHRCVYSFISSHEQREKLVPCGLRWTPAISMAAVFLAVCTCAGSPLRADVYVDDTDPVYIKVGNTSYYEIGFSKADRYSLEYVRDKSTGQDVAVGQFDKVLWGAYFRNGAGAVSSQNHVGTWNHLVSSPILSLRFEDDSGSTRYRVQIDITVTDSPILDMKITLENNSTDSGWVKDVLFPPALLFVADHVDQVLWPFCEGVMLQRKFFTDPLLGTAARPYPGLAADLFHLDSTDGHLAIYAVNTGNEVQPSHLKILKSPGLTTALFRHTNYTDIPAGQTWSSPTIRWQIGATLDACVEDYRTANELDLARSLQEKLGASVYAKLRESVMIKCGFPAFQSGANTFHNFTNVILPSFPNPALIHTISYWPGGFDINYPDYIPPRSDYGTAAEYQALHDEVRKSGRLIMPYTNPTWWDVNSHTMVQPGFGSDVAVTSSSGNPISETYNGTVGYAISQYHPNAVARDAQTAAEFTIGGYPSDLIFEDQVAARGFLYDYNPSSPSRVAYSQGLIDHTKDMTDHLPQMTELVLDRLAHTSVGFCGTAKLADIYDWWWQGDWVYDEDSWRPYPLAPRLFHDKVAFYPHDLDYWTTIRTKANLSHALAMGYNMHYYYNVASDWLPVCDAFQKSVCARYFGQRFSQFEYLSSNRRHSRSRIGDVTVIANLDPYDTFDYAGYSLAASGCLATTDSGDMVAGIFEDTFNGAPLTSGDHYILYDRTSETQVMIQQLLFSPDTQLEVPRPSGWDQGRIDIVAVAADGHALSSVNLTVGDTYVAFNYLGSLGAQMVNHYRITYTLVDCNHNGVDDAMDIATGSSEDCNTNDIPDECDSRDGTSQDNNSNGIPDECEVCITSVDCDDGLFCNGAEECTNNLCEVGIDPCVGKRCRESDDTCVDCLEDDHCDDGLFCNGAEYCSLTGACAPGGAPCPAHLCREIDDSCVDCVAHEDCDDGQFCNGAETCSGGLCASGMTPCVGQACDELGDQCYIQEPECTTDGDCNDGAFCNGKEICAGEVCQGGHAPCAGQLCDEADDVCAACLSDGDCLDTVFCNGREKCTGGFCVGGLSPCPGQVCDEAEGSCYDAECAVDADCDDGNVCTRDTCAKRRCTNTEVAACSDIDSDGIEDAGDACPKTRALSDVDGNGCACDQLDDDGDGVNNCGDACPETGPGWLVDVVGCPDRPLMELSVVGPGEVVVGESAAYTAHLAFEDGAAEDVTNGVSWGCEGAVASLEVGGPQLRVASITREGVLHASQIDVDRGVSVTVTAEFSEGGVPLEAIRVVSIVASVASRATGRGIPSAPVSAPCGAFGLGVIVPGCIILLLTSLVRLCRAGRQPPHCSRG